MDIILRMFEYAKEILKDLSLQDWLGILTLIFASIGGFFALYQWRKSNVYKRGEIVQQLIITVRDDDDIAAIMDIIDWDEDFYYDGKFHINKDTERSLLKMISDDELFKKIDKTLSHFTYICYLKNQHTLTKKDMKIFEYEIRRLVDNRHIGNYLYSLCHWSKSLDVTMSFSFLVEYCKKQKYIDKNSFKKGSHVYTCYLKLPSHYKYDTKTVINI